MLILMTKEIAASNNRLNALRASVLGANDGIVSTAGLVLGVSGAATGSESVLLAGIAGLVSGAISMAAGEYVSVSSLRDSHLAFERRQKDRQTKKTKHESKDEPKDNPTDKSVAEGVKLTKHYIELGMSQKVALAAAREVTKSGKVSEALGETAIDSQLETEPEAGHVVNPWHSSASSAGAFAVGAAIPLLTIALAPESLAPILTAIAVIVSLTLTGYISARIGKSNPKKAAARVVLWGVAAMGITYIIGAILGVSVL